MPNTHHEQTRERFNAMVYILRRHGYMAPDLLAPDHALEHYAFDARYTCVSRYLAVMQKDFINKSELKRVVDKLHGFGKVYEYKQPQTATECNNLIEQCSLELEVRVLRDLLQKKNYDVGPFPANLQQHLEVLREVANGCGVRVSDDEKRADYDHVAQNIHAGVSNILFQNDRSPKGRIISIRQMLADTYVNSPESARSNVLDILAFTLDDVNDAESLLAQFETVCV
jgi:hypothetical protein